MEILKPDTTTLPGHTLSWFGNDAMSKCEREFANGHVRTAADAGTALPEVMRDRLLRLAMDDVVSGHFNWGHRGFDAKALAAESFPFLLWVCLGVAEPRITRDEAKALITRENEDQVRRVVLQMMGYAFTPAVTTTTDPTTATGTAEAA